MHPRHECDTRKQSVEWKSDSPEKLQSGCVCVGGGGYCVVQLTTISSANGTLDGKCQTRSIIYKATVVSGEEEQEVRAANLSKIHIKYSIQIEPDCPVLDALSREQKRLRVQIESNHGNIAELKKARNQVLHRSRDLQRLRANNHLDNIAEHVEKAPHSAQMFGAVKALKKRDVKQSISVTNWDGAFIAQDKEKASVVTEHFHQQFTSVNISAIQSPPPLELNTPISVPEVMKALQCLNNRKACGEDNIPSELLKNGGKVVASFIATFLNTAIVQGLDLSDIIGRGILVPLAKPNKPRGPLSSLRPVVLLNSVRKVFSLIVRRRISKDVSEYLGHISSGFRARRSTSDVVFTQRWISAKVQRFSCGYYALGLDMSKVFDTVDREKILNIMSSFVGQDEVHMIHHLLYGTEMKVRIGKFLSEGFTRTIGTSQGEPQSYPFCMLSRSCSALLQTESSLPTSCRQLDPSGDRICG